MLRTRALGTLFVAIIATIGFSQTASSAAVDLLVGHGNFEKPVVTGLGKTYQAGQAFDGWTVKSGKVTLDRGLSGIIAPAQGKQFLTLIDSFTQYATYPAGVVCRPLATVATHRYRVSFQGTVTTSGTAKVMVKLGSASKSVQLPNGSTPAQWKPFSVTLKALVKNAPFCMTATNGGPKAWPSVDTVKVIDLGV